MVNESFSTSNAVVHKTLINKVCSALKNTKDSEGFSMVILNFGVTKDFYGIDKIEALIRYKIDKFVIEENTDNTYILCNFKASFDPEEFDYHRHAYWELDRDQRISPIIKDHSYGKAASILAIALFGGYGDAVQDAVNKDFYNGTKSSKDILNMSKSDFTSSVAYKKVKGFLDDVASSNIQCKLSDDIYKRIKNRNNSIPVCWISNKEDSFIYITSNNRGNYASQSKITASCLNKVTTSEMASGRSVLPSNWTDRIDWLHWAVPEKNTMNHVVDYWIRGN